MKFHELKAVNPFFTDVWKGIKKFEVRFNDRDYQIGDQLLLREYSLNGYESREILCEIIYIFKGALMLKKGYVILGIKIINKIKEK